MSRLIICFYPIFLKLQNVGLKKANASFESKEALDVSSEIWYDASSSFSQRPSLEENALRQISHPRNSINISEVLTNEQSDLCGIEQEKHHGKVDILEHKNVCIHSIDVFGNLKDFKEETQKENAKIDLLLNKQKDVTEIVVSNMVQDLKTEKLAEQSITPNLITCKSINKDEKIFLTSEKNLVLEEPVQSTSAQKEIHLEEAALSINEATLAEKEKDSIEQEKPRKKKLRVNIKPRQSVKVRQVLLSEQESILKQQKIQDDNAKQSILEKTSLNIYESNLLEKESIKTIYYPSENTASKTQDHQQALTIKQVTSNQDLEQLKIRGQNIQTISLGLTEKKVISKDEEVLLEKEQNFKIDKLDEKQADALINQDEALSIQFRNVFEQTENFSQFKSEDYNANLNLSQSNYRNLLVSDIQTSENVENFEREQIQCDQPTEKMLFRKNENYDVKDNLILETEQKLNLESAKEKNAKQDLTLINLPTSFKQDLLENKKDLFIDIEKPSHVESEIIFNETSNVTETIPSQKESHFRRFKPQTEEAEKNLIFTKSLSIKSSMPLQSIGTFDSEKAKTSSATSNLETNKNVLLIKDTKCSENEIEFEISKPKKIKKLPIFLTNEAIVVKQIDASDLEDKFDTIKNDEKNASRFLMPFESIQVKDFRAIEKEGKFDSEKVEKSTLDNKSFEKHSAVQVQQTLTEIKEASFETLEKQKESATIGLIGQKISSVESENFLEKEQDFKVQKIKKDSATKNLTLKEAFQTSQTTDLLKESSFSQKIKKKKTKPKLEESSLISCDVKTVVPVENTNPFREKSYKSDSAKLNILEKEAFQIEYKEYNDKESISKSEIQKPTCAKLNKELIKRRPISVERKETYLKEDLLKPDDIKKQKANQELVVSDANVVDIQNAIEKEGLLFESSLDDRILRIVIKEKEYHEKIIREQPHSYIRKEGEEILIEERTFVMTDQPEIVEEVQKKIKFKPKSKQLNQLEEYSVEDSLQDTSRDVEEEFISIEQLPESEISEQTVSLKKKRPVLKSVIMKLPDVSVSKIFQIESGTTTSEDQIEQFKLKPKKKSVSEESIILKPIDDTTSLHTEVRIKLNFLNFPFLNLADLLLFFLIHKSR